VFYGLTPNDIYYVQAAARNGVEVQSIDPSGSSPDDTNWSAIFTARPADQKPDAPVLLMAYALARNGIKILFDPPVKDGGQPVDKYLFSWSTHGNFSISNSVSVDASSMDVLYPGDTLIYDLILENPSIIPGIPHFVRVQAVNIIGSSKAADTDAIIPSGPPNAPKKVLLTTLSVDDLPMTETTVEWKIPEGVGSDGGDNIDGYLIKWWSGRKSPEIQRETEVRLV